eukprot:scaffold8428_cov62-Phaeocystis_antarctica.AAC.1
MRVVAWALLRRAEDQLYPYGAHTGDLAPLRAAAASAGSPAETKQRATARAAQDLAALAFPTSAAAKDAVRRELHRVGQGH